MIRAIVAASSDIARASAASLLSKSDGVEVAGLARDADELAQLIRSSAPDVVVIDAGARDESDQFFDALAEVPRSPGVVVMSDEAHAVHPPDGRASAGWARLPRRPSADELDGAVRAVAAGLIVTHPALAESAGHPATVRANHSIVLTPREIEVLRMLADGLPNKTIAKRLGVSAHTVKFHVGSIMSKLHASSRTEAVTDGIRRGLIFV